MMLTSILISFLPNIIKNLLRKKHLSQESNLGPIDIIIILN